MLKHLPEFFSALGRNLSLPFPSPVVSAQPAPSFLSRAARPSLPPAQLARPAAARPAARSRPTPHRVTRVSALSLERLVAPPLAAAPGPPVGVASLNRPAVLPLGRAARFRF